MCAKKNWNDGQLSQTCLLMLYIYEMIVNDVIYKKVKNKIKITLNFINYDSF